MDFGRSLLAYFGFSVDTSELDKGKQKLGDFEKTVNRLVSVAGGTLLAKGFLNFTDGLIDAGLALEKNSVKFGVSTDQFAEWDFAAQRAGVSTESFATGLKFLEKNMAKSDGVGGKALKDFSQLGIDLGGVGEKMKDPLTVLGEVADKVKDAKSPADQLGIALRFLGKGGADLLPLLKDGSAGIQKLRERFQEITGGEGSFAEFATQAKEAHEAETDFALGVQVLRNKFASVFLPVITKVLDKFLAITVFLREVTKNTRAWETAVIALAVGGIGALIYAFGGLALAAAPWVAAATAIYVIMEDLYVFFTGGESLTAKFLDSFFGKGTAQAVVDKVRQLFNALKDFIREEGPRLKAVWEEEVLPALRTVFEFIRDNKNEVFSTLSGMATLASNIASAFRSISNTEAFQKLFGVGDADKKQFTQLAETMALGPLGSVAVIGRSLSALGVGSTRYRGLNPDEGGGVGMRTVEIPFGSPGNNPTAGGTQVIQENTTTVNLHGFGGNDIIGAANAFKSASDKANEANNESARRKLVHP
jgi:hypothetical protein